jgi:capsular polysaccharide transport system permease protein
MLGTRPLSSAPAETAEPLLPTAAGTSAPVARLVFPPPARPAIDRPASRFLSLRVVSFLVVVVGPVAIAAIYYLLIAANQYVAEFRMTLRRAEAPVEPMVLFGGEAVHSAAATESQIVAQYIASRAIVDELDPSLDLRQLFSTGAADWWTRLSLPVSVERLVYYWKGQVDPFYEPSTGTIIVRLRAFAPSDALRLAQAVVASSERLVNDLSARARRDAVGHAEAEVASVEQRLAATLDKIRGFRDQAGLIDPGRTADATSQLATKLRDDLLKANSQLATLKDFMRDDAPPIRVLKARIRSLEAEERGLAHEMTATPTSPSGAPALSQTLGSYEALEAEHKFAEAAYQHALEQLDRARDAADRQQLYIASLVPPSLPEEALYPHRWRSLGVVALIAFALWAIGALAVQSIRDHF